MSNEKIAAAWKEAAEKKRWHKLPATTYNPVHEAFHIGFLAGRADALTLPEVRADELEEGKNFPQEGVAR